MLASFRTKIGEYIPFERGHRVEFFKNFLMQVYYTFVQSLQMLAFLGLASGAAIAFQTQFGLTLLGTNNQLGKILVFILFREVTPLACAMLLIARSITAVASEMATVKVMQEVEALHIMGININHYLLAPRIASGAVSLFCMAVAFWAFALLGGWFGANISSYYPVSQYLNGIAQATRASDFLLFTLKTMLVGGIVSRIGCMRGLSVHGAPFEVPIVTNRAVVDSLTAALGIHFALSITYYVIFGLDL